MGPRIVFVKQFTITDELVREIAPADFDLAIVDAGSPEYEAAIGKAEYLVGFVDASIDDALYAAAPRLKLIQMIAPVTTGPISPPRAAPACRSPTTAAPTRSPSPSTRCC